jgi:CheY-like chemotaxis protein
MSVETTMSRPTILYVEDDSNDILLLQHAFQRAGNANACNLQVFGDSEEAMAYLVGSDKFRDRKRFPLPDLALLDLKMPRLNGFELLSFIRKHQTLRRLPVIVLSSSNHLLDVIRAYDTGANSYLVKPIDFAALVELARSVHQYWLKLNHAPAPYGMPATVCNP